MSVPTYKEFPRIRLRLAKRLRDLRRKHNLTQEKAAALAGIDFTHYVRLESSKPNAVTIDSLEKLGRAFKMHASDLIKNL